MSATTGICLGAFGCLVILMFTAISISEQLKGIADTLKRMEKKQ